jgi:menaquinone-dependent protoporphyrinogen oxidase
MKKILYLLLIFSVSSCSAKEKGTLTHSYGNENSPSGKLLVVYCSVAGSTAEVADSIGKEIAAKGYYVQISPVKEVKSVDGFKAVVIGSAIRMGQVKGEIVDFVKDFKPALQTKSVSYFVVCMTLKDDTPENRKTVDAYVDPLRNELKPVDVGLFAGKMDYSKLGFFSRFIIKHMVKTPEGDFRKWNEIKGWAKDLKL